MRDERAVSGSESPRGSSGDPDARQRKRRHRRIAAFAVLGLLIFFLAPAGLRRLDYFRVRRVEIVGAQYIPPRVIQERLALDSSSSVWDKVGGLEDRVREHPQVRDARISRRLPGTLVVRITENLPVALVSTSDGLVAYDRDGKPLPIDPSRTRVDLPLVVRPDTLVLRMLDGVRAADAALFARVSEVRWDDRGGLRVLMSGVTVRAPGDCTAARFLEIVPVEKDLTRRGQRAAEFDLRYRDQIVARIE